jgi:hypothetical protein
LRKITVSNRDTRINLRTLQKLAGANLLQKIYFTEKNKSAGNWKNSMEFFFLKLGQSHFFELHDCNATTMTNTAKSILIFFISNKNLNY